MKRLLLVNPALTGPVNRSLTVAGFATMEPLGLAHVAALTPADWQIRIADESVEALPSWHEFPADLVGITALTPTAPRAYEIAGSYHRHGAAVVMGGAHASLCPEEAERFVDAVVCGEAEGAWPAVVEDFERGGLRTRYRAGARDLRGLPLPRRDLYRRRYRVSLVSSSRGCLNRCEFCAIWKFEGGAFRARPIDDVLAELPHVPQGAVTLFTDDNIMCDRDRALALFRAIADRGLRRRHVIQATLDVADDDELLRALTASGCLGLVIGLESVNESTLRVMRKGVNLGMRVERYREKIGRLHRHGLMVAATFILGADGDGPDVFERTSRFVVEAGVDLAHFGLLVPTPGTDTYQRLERERRLLLSRLPDDYRLLDLNHATFVPRGMSTEAAEAGLARATRAVARWPVALRRAVRTWWDTGHLWAAGLSLLWTRTGLHRRVFGVR